jgi:hypothetical protein
MREIAEVADAAWLKSVAVVVSGSGEGDTDDDAGSLSCFRLARSSAIRTPQAGRRGRSTGEQLLSGVTDRFPADPSVRWSYVARLQDEDELE